MTDRPEPLGLTVHSLPEPTLDGDRQRTARGRLAMLLILAACAAPVVGSYLTYFVVRPQHASAAYGTLIQPSVSLPDIMVADAAGATLPLRSLKGQWLMVAVGPAACDAACEKRLYTQRQLREMLGRDRDRVEKVWLLTDTGALRPELAAALAHGEPVRLLRADAASVQAWLKPAAGHALQEHLYIVDPMGEWMMRVPVDPDPSKVKRDLERLLRASASWDRAGR
jgi:hypothetical protein